MPELPEVETVRRGLEQQTRGFLIDGVEVLRARAIASPEDPAAFCRALRGLRVGRWHRRGKYPWPISKHQAAVQPDAGACTCA